MVRSVAAVTVSVLAAALVSSVGATAIAPASGTGAAVAGAFTEVRVASFGVEPSIITGPDGSLYMSVPGLDGPDFYRSIDRGTNWTQGATADAASGAGGDDGLATDTSGAIFEVNMTTNTRRREIYAADVYRSSDDGGSWGQRGRAAQGDGSSTLPEDRPWIGAWLKPGDPPNKTRVYLVYRDLVSSGIWVAISSDAGAHFGPPIPIVTSPLAVQATACIGLPGGVQVVSTGRHAGRVYVAWTGGDAATDAATGCYFTMLNAAHTVWVAWSDDGGLTWSNHLVYDAGVGHDTSGVFARLALDDQGNPYVAFAANLAGEYDVYVEASFDGGRRWNGGRLGLAAPIKASVGKGTHLFPAIAAGDPGKVDVAYIATPTVVPLLPNGKPAPGAGNGASWSVFVAQTLDLRSHPTWQTFAVTPEPIHMGDVCIEGGFCGTDMNRGDRSLGDFIDMTVDHFGFAHVAYADTRRRGLYEANQLAGPAIL